MAANKPWILLAQDPETKEVVDYVITDTQDEAKSEEDSMMASWPWSDLFLTPVNSDVCISKLGKLEIE